MRIKFIFLLFLVMTLMVTSCQKEEEIIPRKEMIPILVDIHLLDGAIQHTRRMDTLAVPDTIQAYEYVLEEHGYTREQFDSTMNYYSRDLRKFERVYQEVLARLNRMETEAREEKEQKMEKKADQEDDQKGRKEEQRPAG